MPPERSAPPVVILLEASAHRRCLLDAVEAVAIGLSSFAVSTWIARGFAPAPATALTGTAVGLLAAALLFARWRKRQTTAAAARRIEALRPGIRNLAVTAEELTRHPERASVWMTARVLHEASRAVEGLAPAEVWPAPRTAGAATLAMLAIAAVVLAPDARQTSAAVAELARSAADSVLGRVAPVVTISMQPPGYSGLERRSVTNPERLEVLEGTHLQFALRSGPAARLRFGARELGTLTAGGAPSGVVARDNGYFALDPSDAAAPATLIALSVVRDRAPAVTIEKPARDLLLPAAATRTLPIQISATDDLGLSSLELRYTKVSGSGELFEFIEGALPLRITRGSAREWRAHADLPVGELAVVAGDSVVYRAVARDARPGDAGLGSSDTFFVEIAGPGQVPLEGIEMPPEEERYALSQQMIVLKIERLRARERSLSRQALAEETALLAAEQRSVRANFVFLLGGHVEDEEVEAEQASEIAEGRLQNTARRDINAAIGHMTRAERGLVAVDTSIALPPARAAVEALQRAFGRSRYLLRSLASRSRLDPSRRLTGNVAAAGDWRRPEVAAEPRAGEPARALFSELVAAHAALAGGAVAIAGLQDLAERALAIDPASPRWQDVARRIQRAQSEASRPAEAKRILDGLIGELSDFARAGLVPPAGVPAPASPLERAWRGGSR